MTPLTFTPTEFLRLARGRQSIRLVGKAAGFSYLTAQRAFSLKGPAARFRPFLELSRALGYSSTVDGRGLTEANLAPTLRALRNHWGLSRHTLARRADVMPWNVERYETQGTKSPLVMDLGRLFAELQAPWYVSGPLGTFLLGPDGFSLHSYDS